MNTDRRHHRSRAGWRSRLLLAAGLVAAAGALAQAPANTPANSPTNPPAAAPALGSPIAGSPPLGSGPGFHDPRSVFKPLQEREGVVSWKLLSSVVAKVQRDKVIPVFPPAVRSLDATAVKVQGFMLPLEPGEKQRHFLLSAVPTTCNFCVPAGPEGLVEVRTREPIRYTVDAITVQGRFAVLYDDKYGLFYRVADASVAP